MTEPDPKGRTLYDSIRVKCPEQADPQRWKAASCLQGQWGTGQWGATANGDRFPLGQRTCFETRQRRLWSHNIVNTLNATESYALKSFILRYVNSHRRKKRGRVEQDRPWSPSPVTLQRCVWPCHCSPPSATLRHHSGTCRNDFVITPNERGGGRGAAPTCALGGQETRDSE